MTSGCKDFLLFSLSIAYFINSCSNLHRKCEARGGHFGPESHKFPFWTLNRLSDEWTEMMIVVSNRIVRGDFSIVLTSCTVHIQKQNPHWLCLIANIPGTMKVKTTNYFILSAPI